MPATQYPMCQPPTITVEGGDRLYDSPLMDSEPSSTLRKVQFKMASGTLIQLQIDTNGYVKNVIERLCSLSGLSNPLAFDLIYYAMPTSTSPQESPMTLRKGGKSGILKGKLRRKSQEPTYASLDDLLGGAEQPEEGQSPHWERRRKQMLDLDKKWAKHSSSVTAEGICQMDRSVPFYSQGFCEAEHILELINRRQVSTSSQSPTDVVTETDLALADFERCSKQFTSGTWPCDVQQASRIAALQAHVMYGGDITATKASMLPKTLNEKLKEFLPAHYRKDKSALKLALQQFSKHSNISLEAARQLYVDCCKQLATYEATFFVVKAPCPNRRAIMPCVLSISPTTVVRLDGKTRQVVEKWPLSEVVNSMASPAVFGLLFVDESQFTVMTFQADKIQAVIKQHREEMAAKEKANYAEIPDPEYNTIASEPAASSTSASEPVTATVQEEDIYDEIPATFLAAQTSVASDGAQPPVLQAPAAVTGASSSGSSSYTADDMQYDYIHTMSPDDLLTHSMRLPGGGMMEPADRDAPLYADRDTQDSALEVDGENKDANDDNHDNDGSDTGAGYEVRRNEFVETPVSTLSTVTQSPPLPVTTDSDDGYEVHRNDVAEPSSPLPPFLATSPPLFLTTAATSVTVGANAAKIAEQSAASGSDNVTGDVTTDGIDSGTHDTAAAAADDDDGDDYLEVIDGARMLAHDTAAAAAAAADGDDYLEVSEGARMLAHDTAAAAAAADGDDYLEVSEGARMLAHDTAGGQASDDYVEVSEGARILASEGARILASEGARILANDGAGAQSGDGYLEISEGARGVADDNLYFVRPDEWTKPTAAPLLPTAVKPPPSVAMVKLNAPVVMARRKDTSLTNSLPTSRPRPQSKISPSNEVTMMTTAPRTVYTMLELQTSGGPGIAPPPVSSSSRANGPAPLWATPAAASAATAASSDSPKAAIRQRPVPATRTRYDDVIPMPSGKGMKMVFAPQPANMAADVSRGDVADLDAASGGCATDQPQQDQQRQHRLQKRLSTTNPFYTS